jgi:hypothetical protein
MGECDDEELTAAASAAYAASAASAAAASAAYAAASAASAARVLAACADIVRRWFPEPPKEGAKT